MLFENDGWPFCRWQEEYDTIYEILKKNILLLNNQGEYFLNNLLPNFKIKKGAIRCKPPIKLVGGFIWKEGVN